MAASSGRQAQELAAPQAGDPRSGSADAGCSGLVRMAAGGETVYAARRPGVPAMRPADPGEADDVGCRVGTQVAQTHARSVLADAEVRPVLIVVADERVEQPASPRSPR